MHRTNARTLIVIGFLTAAGGLSAQADGLTYSRYRDLMRTESSVPGQQPVPITTVTFHPSGETTFENLPIPLMDPGEWAEMAPKDRDAWLRNVLAGNDQRINLTESYVALDVESGQVFLIPNTNPETSSFTPQMAERLPLNAPENSSQQEDRRTGDPSQGVRISISIP